VRTPLESHLALLHLLASFSRYAHSSRAGFLRGLWFCTKIPRSRVVYGPHEPDYIPDAGPAGVSKVTWPSRNEVLVSTIMVLVLVLLASIFFLLADQVISWLVSLMLSIR
jgi:preprotein translocase subunit SecE